MISLNREDCNDEDINKKIFNAFSMFDGIVYLNSKKAIFCESIELAKKIVEYVTKSYVL